jgi:hypothetical protein
MNLNSFYNTYCTVQRTETTIGALNRPTDVPITMGTYQCRIGKTTGTYVQGHPQALGVTAPRLYTVAEADIKKGDIVIVDGAKYYVKNAYKPGGNHTECDIERKDEP